MQYKSNDISQRKTANDGKLQNELTPSQSYSSTTIQMRLNLKLQRQHKRQNAGQQSMKRTACRKLPKRGVTKKCNKTQHKISCNANDVTNYQNARVAIPKRQQKRALRTANPMLKNSIKAYELSLLFLKKYPQKIATTQPTSRRNLHLTFKVHLLYSRTSLNHSLGRLP